jgi:hypothetical protein
MYSVRLLTLRLAYWVIFALGGLMTLSSSTQGANVTVSIIDNAVDEFGNELPVSATGADPNRVGITTFTSAPEFLSLSWKAPSAGATIVSTTWFTGNNGTTKDGGNGLYEAEQFLTPGSELSDTLVIVGGCRVGDPTHTGQNTFCIMDFSSSDGRVCPSTGCDTFEIFLELFEPAFQAIWSDGTIDLTQFKSDVDPQAVPEPSTGLLLLASLAIIGLLKLTIAFERTRRLKSE